MREQESQRKVQPVEVGEILPKVSESQLAERDGDADES